MNWKHSENSWVWFHNESKGWRWSCSCYSQSYIKNRFSCVLEQHTHLLNSKETKRSWFNLVWLKTNRDKEMLQIALRNPIQTLNDGYNVWSTNIYFGENLSVMCKTSIPYSTMKKNSQSITYHLFWQSVARDKWRTAYVSTHKNEDNLLTKCLPPGDKRKGFIRNVLHHIFGNITL